MAEMGIKEFRDLVEEYLPVVKKSVYDVRLFKNNLCTYHHDPDGIVGIECKIKSSMLKNPELEAQKMADSIDAAMLKYYRDAKSHREYVFQGSDYYKGVTQLK